MDTNLGATVSLEKGELEPNFKLANILGKIVDVCLYLSVILVPLFFLPFTLDILELNKQTLFIILSGVATLAWIGQAVSLRKFSLSRSWLHLVVVVFLLGYFITSWFSPDRYLSFVGNFGQMQWSMATIAALVLFYLVVVNVVKGTSKLYNLIFAFLLSSLAVGLYGVFQMFGIYLFGWAWDFSKANTFNTVGTINSFGVYMVLPLVLAASLKVLGCKDNVCVLGKGGKPSLWANIIVWATLAVSTLVAIIVDFWVVWAAILFGTALLVLIPVLRTRTVEKSLKLIVPSALVVLSVVLLLFRTPINLQLPAEVSPSSSASWNIARQVLQEKPLFGSGPGTWIFDYSKYRSVGVNLSQFWTIRFERGISTFLTLLATIGLVGMALWLILVLSGVVKSAKHLLFERNDDTWQAYLTVFAAWATAVFIAFFYNYNFTHHFIFWFFLALLGSLVASGTMTWDARKSVASSSILSLVFLILCVVGVSMVWLSTQRLVADAEYAQAVQSFRNGKPIDDSITALNSAAALNRWNDVYYRNLSQAYLIRASQEMQLPADQDRANKVNASVTMSVDQAKHAADMSPANVDNWANFAVILQSIASFTRGADERAIELFGEALKREPNNPTFINEIGKLHVLRSDAYRQLLQSEDEAVKKDAQDNIKNELDKAAEALNQSIQMKQDFAAAHYNLGLVYERQGRIQDAIVKLEQVLQTDTRNIGVAFQLAILYYRNNEKDKSLDMFEQIVTLEPGYANARWYLSAIYEERGRYDSAIAQVEKVAEANPNDQLVQDRLQYLIDLRDKKSKPAVAPLPEPVKEEISGPSEQNEVKQP
ncbi:tetratricopeptide repeat protein [Patescibacteria group bacterium]|nr:tetratricopeptide repeat protein [Patescibacteria group bacterium]